MHIGKNNQAIDCDLAKYGRQQAGHGAMYANDTIDDITVSDQLFIAYGKQYWLYRPFWDTLSATDQREAAKVYQIDPVRELIDF